MTIERLKSFNSVRETAQKLGISRQHVHKLIKKGELHAYEIDNFYITTDIEIERFISSRNKSETDNRYKIR